jgi:hypothetical protein
MALQFLNDGVFSRNVAGTILTSQKASIPPSNGSFIGRLNFKAYNVGTTYSTGASITAVASSAWTSTNTGTHLQFSTTSDNQVNPVNKMYLTSGGDLGVGVQFPGSRISVSGFTGTYTSGIGFEPVGTGARIYRTFINTDGSFNLDDATAGESRLTIDSAGNVGIGTSTFQYSSAGRGNLEVNGDSGAGKGSILALKVGDTHGAYLYVDSTITQVYSHLETPMTFYTNATERMRIDSSGAIKFNAYGAGTLVSDASGNITVSSGGGAGGPYLPLSAGASYPLTDTLYVRENGNKNNGTISMGLGGSGTGKWSFLTGTHYNQATGSGNGTGSAGMAIIGSLATETYNKIYIGGGPYEINAATQIDFWTHSGILSTAGGTRRGYVDNGGNWFLSDTLWVDNADEYVGIGTTNPGSKLEVNVIDDSFDDIDVLKLKRTWATGSSTDRAHGISFNDPNSRMATIYADRTNSGSNYNSQLLFSVNSGTSGTSMITPMVINNLGRVGIGTNNPGATLDVAKGSEGLYFSAGGDTTDARSLDFTSSSNNGSNGAMHTINAKSGNGVIAFATGSNEKMRISSNGSIKFNAYNSTNNTGTATYLLGTDAAGNVVKTTAAPSANFNQGAKTHSVGTAFSNVLTVALSSHQGCYVTLCCFGDWGGHSSAAYRGEFFLQNGAGIYNEPGIIIRQDDNTSDGTDQIICQILDPGGSTGSRNFIIQIRHTDTTSPATFTGTITFTVQGQFNSVT